MKDGRKSPQISPSVIFLSLILLDEHLSWRSKQEATPSLTAALLDTATKLSYRKAIMEAQKYSAGCCHIPQYTGYCTWHKEWDLGSVKLVVVGGDDAEWIDKGTEELPYSIRQLSGFHLSRSCRRGWKQGKDIYEVIRSPVRVRFKMVES